MQNRSFLIDFYLKKHRRNFNPSKGRKGDLSLRLVSRTAVLHPTCLWYYPSLKPVSDGLLTLPVHQCLVKIKTKRTQVCLLLASKERGRICLPIEEVAGWLLLHGAGKWCKMLQMLCGH